jgi:hypothetical protein
MGYVYSFKTADAISKIAEDLQTVSDHFTLIAKDMGIEKIDPAAIVFAQNAYDALEVLESCAEQSRIAWKRQLSAKNRHQSNPYLAVKEESKKTAKRRLQKATDTPQDPKPAKRVRPKNGIS